MDIISCLVKGNKSKGQTVFIPFTYGIQNLCLKPEVKVNGSYKIFTVKFYDDEDNENQIPVLSGHWEFKICELNLDAIDLVEYKDSTPPGEDMYKQIQLKFIGGDEWISKNLHVWYISDTGIKSRINVNIVGI